MQANLFDIHQIGRPGRADSQSLAYLLEPVNAELEQRVREVAPDCRDWLQIDFPGSSLELPGQVESCSLMGPSAQQIDVASALRPFEGIVINLQLSWLDPGDTISDLLRLLKPGGHLFFTTFGPDTLYELRAAWAEVDDAPHVHPFIDLHHLGDMLVKNGFQRPIVDSDWLGVQYEDGELLMQDLRRAGFHNVQNTRRKTLTGKGRFEAVRQLLEASGSPLNITWEIVYGYGMRPATNKQDGVQVSFSG